MFFNNIRLNQAFASGEIPLIDKNAIQIQVDQIPDLLRNQAESLVSDSEFNLAPTLRGGSDGETPKCGFQYAGLKVGTKGVIATPNYPDNYPPDIQCIWWLKGVENTRILVTCDQIETQPCYPDFYDYALLAPDWSWSKYSM